MNRLFATTAALILCSMLVVSCGKRYVGEWVGVAGGGWSHYSEKKDNGVQHYLITHEWVEFDLQISKTELPSEYLIEGTIDLSKGGAKSASQIEEAKTRFSILFASNGVIVDNVPFQPVYTGNIGSKLPFKFKYKREGGFGRFKFVYDLYVIG